MEPRQLPLWEWGLHTWACSGVRSSHTGQPCSSPSFQSQDPKGKPKPPESRPWLVCAEQPRVLGRVCHPLCLSVNPPGPNLPNGEVMAGTVSVLHLPKGLLSVPGHPRNIANSRVTVAPKFKEPEGVKAAGRLLSGREPLSHWSSEFLQVTKLVFGVRQRSHSRDEHRAACPALCLQQQPTLPPPRVSFHTTPQLWALLARGKY